MSYTIVGVTGHIDHGKTTLVKALTGVDTDSHPEEKRRGITIDLGFASFTHGDHEFALIDAPGHQKYIGNLLAGVSHIDIGLLVVAADQGIQAQTLEHASILGALGASRLIVAVSRIDLVEECRLAELTDELELFLGDLGFADFPIISLSAQTGVGLDDLITQLCQPLDNGEACGTTLFRMPIDRVLNIPGRGTVIAGTVWSGDVCIGDTLQLAGSEQRFRVRELEVHGQSVERSTAGRRTAINVTGSGQNAKAPVRGQELVAPGTHDTTQRVLIEMSLFSDVRPFKTPATVHLHLGTAVCEARVRCEQRLSAGQSGVVVVETSEPVVATFGQFCLFRKPYPVGSFAGGRVLTTLAAGPRKHPSAMELGNALRDADASSRLAAWVNYCGELQIDATKLELQLGISSGELASCVQVAIDQDRIVQIDELLVSCREIDRIESKVLELLTQQAEESENAWIEENSLAHRHRRLGSVEASRYVIDRLVSNRRLVRSGHMLAFASDATVLSKKQQTRMDRILDAFSDSRTPPTTKELAKSLDISQDAVVSLIRFATQQGRLTDLGKGFVIATDVLRQLQSELDELFQQGSERTVAEIRDHWQLTRKYAIPLLEYFDRSGVTNRNGDIRTAG